MRACCNAQRVIVFRSIHTAEVATSTVRLKTGADDPRDEAIRWAAEFFAPPTLGGERRVGNNVSSTSTSTKVGTLPPLFSGCATTENGAIEYQ
jgi:hypothetical protein